MEGLMEAWRYVFRNGAVPSMSIHSLRALRNGLQNDDYRLVQGHTAVPTPLKSVADWPCEGACATSYGYWQGSQGGQSTVADVESYFAGICYEIEKTLGESAAVRHFLNWFDDTPREQMIRELLPEVEIAIQSKEDCE